MNGSCYFTRKVIVPELPKLVKNLLGTSATKEDIQESSMQTFIIARMIDNRNGFDSTDDVMPARSFRRSTTPELLDETRKLVYEKLGLDDGGKVGAGTLDRYGMAEFSRFL
jgi:aldehyde:ferredoxin oxidoreductase